MNKPIPPGLRDMADKAQQDKAAWERLCVLLSWGLALIGLVMCAYLVYRFVVVFIYGA